MSNTKRKLAALAAGAALALSMVVMPSAQAVGIDYEGSLDVATIWDWPGGGLTFFGDECTGYPINAIQVLWWDDNGNDGHFSIQVGDSSPIGFLDVTGE